MRVLIAVLCLLCLAGCVSTRTTHLENQRAAELRGKVVALTDRPRAGFVAMTAGKAMFGMLGAAAMIEAGKEIVTENDIPDPAPAVDQALMLAAQKEYGILPATIAPVKIDTTDISKLAAAAHGADVLFDVQGVAAQFRYLPMQWGKYVVETSYKFRIIDVRAQKMIAEGFCFQSTKDEPTHPTRDELLADKAAQLKGILNAQREQCTHQFASQVLSLPDQPAST